jgi:hypothetical protein
VSDVGRRPEEIAAYYDASIPPSLLPIPDPVISALVPDTASAGAGPTVVLVNGSKFQPYSIVEIDQAAQPTTYVSSTRLSVSYDPATAGTVTFTVRSERPPAAPVESNSVPFVVAALDEDTVSAALVASWSIDQVKAFVVAHPTLLAEVLAFERDGKARSTLLTWLQQLVDEEAESEAQEQS